MCNIHFYMRNIYFYQVSHPVHPKGNQSWLFIGSTDAEVESPVLWPPDMKNWLIWKDPDAGKDWRQEEKGTTEDEMVGWRHRLSWHGFGWTPGVGDGQGSLAFMGSQRVRHNWATELKLIQMETYIDFNYTKLKERKTLLTL